MADIDVLIAELTNDPGTRGYASMSDEEAAIDLNTSRISRNLTSISGKTIKQRIDEAEYAALLPTKKAELLSLLSRDDLDPFGFDATVVRDIFGNGSTTLSNLAGSRTENISRAQELGLGVVKAGHVNEARR